MPVSADHEMVALVDRWTHRFGYHDNRIDLAVDDLDSFTTADASLVAHAPLWGTKDGGEEAVPVAEVRRRLARLLRIARASRHDMHLAIHPNGRALCLFFTLKARLRLLPITVRTEKLAFVVVAAETADGLRIHAVHEWAAADPAEAGRIVIDEHGWPTDTVLEPYRGFGASS